MEEDPLILGSKIFIENGQASISLSKDALELAIIGSSNN